MKIFKKKTSTKLQSEIYQKLMYEGASSTDQNKTPEEPTKKKDGKKKTKKTPQESAPKTSKLIEQAKKVGNDFIRAKNPPNGIKQLYTRDVVNDAIKNTIIKGKMKPMQALISILPIVQDEFKSAGNNLDKLLNQTFFLKFFGMYVSSIIDAMKKNRIQKSENSHNLAEADEIYGIALQVNDIIKSNQIAQTVANMQPVDIWAKFKDDNNLDKLLALEYFLRKDQKGVHVFKTHLMESYMIDTFFTLSQDERNKPEVRREYVDKVEQVGLGDTIKFAGLKPTPVSNVNADTILRAYQSAAEKFKSEETQHIKGIYAAHRMINKNDRFLIYKGPSRLGGDDKKPIIAYVTWGSSNEKTGNSAQVWFAYEDMNVSLFGDTEEISAICGRCPHRRERLEEDQQPCYVLRHNLGGSYNSIKEGRYVDLTGDNMDKILENPTLKEIFKSYFNRPGNDVPLVRWGAYGDPASIPIDVTRKFRDFSTEVMVTNTGSISFEGITSVGKGDEKKIFDTIYHLQSDGTIKKEEVDSNGNIILDENGNPNLVDATQEDYMKILRSKRMSTLFGAGDYASTGYTHQWKNRDSKEYQDLTQASVDIQDEFITAAREGWGTFRVQSGNRAPINGYQCPATHSRQLECQVCKQCSGDKFKQIYIKAHGSGAEKKVAHIDELEAKTLGFSSVDAYKKQLSDIGLLFVEAHYDKDTAPKEVMDAQAAEWREMDNKRTALAQAISEMDQFKGRVERISKRNSKRAFFTYIPEEIIDDILETMQLYPDVDFIPAKAVLYTVERLGPKFAIDALENETFKSAREKSGGLMSFEKERSRFPRSNKIEVDDEAEDEPEEDTDGKSYFGGCSGGVCPSIQKKGVGPSAEKKEEPEEKPFDLLDLAKRKKESLKECISVDDLVQQMKKKLW